MEVLETVSDLRETLSAFRSSGKKIGLVPTMGYLHEGHYSLIRAARRECEVVVVSIFVNPTQFGPAEDLDQYPQDLAGDCQGCRKEGVDIVFAPAVEEMYPSGFQTYVTVEEVTKDYCGRYRPGHFRGVTTVVIKLFNMVAPDVAYFGEKDFQQSVAVRRMVADLDLPIEIRVLPTVRERDGLAMSSRNRYLSGPERAAATVLFRTLQMAREKVSIGERFPRRILDAVQEVFDAEPLVRLQYAGIADDDTLEPAERIEGHEHLLLAAFVGETRLIDNASFADVVGDNR